MAFSDLVNKIKPPHVFMLLFVFWSLWLYTEVTEYVGRAAFATEVKEFMKPGPRFTAEDGAELAERLHALEAREKELESKLQEQAE